MSPAEELPLLVGHQQENYWVQSAVLALQIKGGLQSRRLPYESNKFPLEKKKKKNKHNHQPTLMLLMEVLLPFVTCWRMVSEGRAHRI